MSHKIFYRLISLMLAFTVSFAGFSPALAAPPDNDDFDNAVLINAVPFSDTRDTSEATSAFDDPTSCYNTGSVWYQFTPQSDMTIIADTIGSNYDTTLSVFTGSRGALNQIGCNDDYFGLQSRVVFSAAAGTTYYFMPGVCCSNGGTGGGNLTFSISEFVAQPPQANFGFSPGDPSKYDTVQFYDQSYDPEGIGIESFAWDFGDGTTATDPYPVHQYAADGDYTVQHAVTTYDGRSVSTSQVVHVRTHDVAIIKVLAPKSATSGQTRAIDISVRNTFYPETVRIDLYRSVAGGGFEWIASSTQFVPVRSGNRTSQFTFNYTFTLQDAQTGKVTFWAVATVLNVRDAFPADNEAFSSPTRVAN